MPAHDPPAAPPALSRALLFASALLALLVPPSYAQTPAADTVLHAARIDEIRFRSHSFELVGNLYLPDSGSTRCPAVVWVSGSGPSFRAIRSRETIKVVNCFLDRGFAFFRLDKPGSGESRGTLSDDSLFAQLSDVAADAVERLRAHPRIDPAAVGLFGSSQAGYLMPLAIAKCRDVAFMMGSSCPGESSIEQWNYLLERQLRCEGMPAARAREAVRRFAALRTTTRKQDFDRALEYFERHPLVVRAVGYDSSFAEQARGWWPRTIDLHDEPHFDPMSLVARLRLPIFLAYGAHDTQIDPGQAMAAYRRACGRAGNRRLRLAWLRDSDHNMSLSGGCLSEISALGAAGAYPVDPAYLATLGAWLDELRRGVRARR